MGPSWNAFGPRPRKTTKNLAWVPFFWVYFRHISYFSDACFLTCFVNLSPTSFLRQRHPRASISNAFGRHLVYIWNKCEQLETAILCRMVLKNQALEGLCFTLFHHFHAQIAGTFYCHASFDDLSTFCTFAPPLEAFL